MNKSEIQARIEKCESELASLKADIAKCEDGIEQERCWHAVNEECGVRDIYARTKKEVVDYSPFLRPAYMPECRQVTTEDARDAARYYLGTGSIEEMASALHKAGFRIKVMF